MQDILLKPISVYGRIYSQTEDVYFSHSDHLGSANWSYSGSMGSIIGNINFFGGRIPGSSRTLVGSKETLLHSFYRNFNFNSVRGTSAGVSYNRKTMQPEPQFFFQSWTILKR